MQKIPLSKNENLDFRIDIHQKCKTDVSAQDMAISLCKEDILNFFRMYGWTNDPRKSPSDLPFLPYPFQEKLIKEINNAIISGEDLLIDKCRDMGATWCILTVFTYRYLFFDESFLVGSRKEELVDTIGNMNSHFERIRYILKMLPDWMKDRLGVKEANSGYMKIYKEVGAQISGESMNPQFSRQGRYKGILLDEFAFVEKAELIWRATGDSAPCRIPVSTPNGRHNYFAELRFSGRIKAFSLDWTMHPEKDEDWYAEEKAKRTRKDLAQEVDRSYTISAGEPFYEGFSRALHVRKYTPNPHKLLIPSFDYGFNMTACTLHQLDTEGRWVIVDTIIVEKMLTEQFGGYVKAYLNQNYSGFRWQEKAFDDPAGRQASDKSRYTNCQILRNLGFPVKSLPSNLPTTNYAARKNIIEKKLSRLVGGIPELTVHDTPNNEIVIEAFEGGYRYPDANKYGKAAEKPVDDGFYEHPMNTIEYFAINIFNESTQGSPATKRHKAKALQAAKVRNGGFGY